MPNIPSDGKLPEEEALRKLLLLMGLSMLGVLILAPAALAEHRYGCPHDKPFVATAPGDPGEGSLQCFATRAEANAYSETGSTATPTASAGIKTPAESCNDQPDPAGCKRQLRGAEGLGSATPSATATATASASAAGAAQYQYTPVLPSTGGVSPTLLAIIPAMLLVGGGLLSARLIRRS